MTQPSTIFVLLCWPNNQQEGVIVFRTTPLARKLITAGQTFNFYVGEESFDSPRIITVVFRDDTQTDDGTIWLKTPMNVADCLEVLDQIPDVEVGQVIYSP
jgi:hypothetical protein